MEAQVTSYDDFAGRQPLLLVSRLHRSSHCLYIASNRPLNEYNRVSFLHAILCYHKSTDNVTFSIDSGVMSVRKYINSMWRRWNSTAIKRMREQLKPGPFSSSPSSGLGMRLVWRMLFCLENVIYLLDVTPSNPLLHSLFPTPISLHVIQVKKLCCQATFNKAIMLQYTQCDMLNTSKCFLAKLVT